MCPLSTIPTKRSDCFTAPLLPWHISEMLPATTRNSQLLARIPPPPQASMPAEPSSDSNTIPSAITDTCGIPNTAIPCLTYRGPHPARHSRSPSTRLAWLPATTPTATSTLMVSSAVRTDTSRLSMRYRVEQPPNRLRSMQTVRPPDGEMTVRVILTVFSATEAAPVVFSKSPGHRELLAPPSM